jgi:hypothetical protein
MDDWVKIKEMMDKVVPEKEIVTITLPRDTAPYQPNPDIYPPTIRNPWEHHPNPWHTEPHIGDVPPYDTFWCGDYTSVSDCATNMLDKAAELAGLSGGELATAQFKSLEFMFKDWNDDGSKKENK